jgi:hypothetical protein
MKKKSKSREAILNRWIIIFLISGLLAGLSIFWILPYCEWQGPCVSAAPLVFGVIIPRHFGLWWDWFFSWWHDV